MRFIEYLFRQVRRLAIILLLFLNFFAVTAQDTIPTRQPIDTTAVDTITVDTIVIRAVQTKIRNIPRSVNLTNPIVSFKKTKARTKAFNKFKVPSFWQNENILKINLNEAAFVNWKAGGDNSIAAAGNLKFIKNYKFRYIQWDNDLEFRYGLNAQEGRKIRKTEDLIRLSSTFGYRRDTLSNWYYSVKANFNTQFSNGYKYPDRSTPVSRFMAPGYLFLGAGTSYIPDGKSFNLYISPITQKMTYVQDQTLANQGAFGVKKAVFDADGNLITPGKKVFMEFGFLITNTWQKQIFENVYLDHRINLYTDYLRRFGNIDVDWELNIKLVVNKYIQTNIGTQIIYDDDIKFEELRNEDGTIVDSGGPRIQFKQILGVGVAYSF
ncbi:hypothetical protein SB49_11155 [Sediminicola sp. YIK13]|uniref:DUF3078 domain-containing protein n=1 Tax=Sediminicola sp. YIK13 TaxID=1453352 RepID=UPI000722E95E|nr:DUF3078 domain-containing protein [Sediminicola sp. YIK13]ALM08298.1 hypothetical protein SB49_11155 [Sediminicola sp. YIK13]